MAVIGSAEVLVRPSFVGFQKQVGQQLQRTMAPAARAAGQASGAAMSSAMAAPVSKASWPRRAFGRIQAAGSNAANRIGTSFRNQSAIASQSVGGIGTQMRGMIKMAAGFAAAMGLVNVVRAGWDTAAAFDGARASLTGLLGSAQEASKVTTWIENLRSPIDSASMLKFSETLAYLGLNANDTTKLMDRFNTAIIGTGGGAEEIDRANDGLTRLVNQGKPTADVLDQISGSGMPVWSMIADKYSTDIPAVRKMVSDGALSVEDVMAAMATGTSDSFRKQSAAFEQAQKTWAYQWPVFVNETKKAIAGIIAPLQQQLGPVLATVGPKITGAISGIPAAFGRLRDAIIASGVWGAITSFATGLGSILKASGPLVSGALTGLGTAFGMVAMILKPLGDRLQAIGDWMSRHPGTIKVIGTLFGVFAGSLLIATGALKAVAAAQAILNAVMLANPVGLVIAGIIALATLLVLAYKRSETFRRVVNKAFTGVQTVVAAVVDFFRDHVIPIFVAVGTELRDRVGPIVENFIAIWENLFSGDIAGAAQAWLDYVGSIGTAIKDAAVDLGGALYEKGEELIDGLIQGAKDAFPDVKEWVEGLPGRVHQAAEDLGNAMVERGGNMVDGLVRGIKRGVPRLIEWFQQLPERIQTWVGNAGDWLKNNGPQIIQGLINGIKTALPILGVFVLGIPLLIAGSVIAGAGLLALAGGTLAWTLLKGLGDGIGDLAFPIVQSALEWVKNAFIKGWGAIQTHIVAPVQRAWGRVRRIWESIKSVFGRARDWVRNTWSKGWNKVTGFIGGAVERGRDLAGRAWTGTQNRFTRAKNWTQNTWSKGWNKVRDWIGNPVESGRSRVTRAKDQIQSGLNRLKTWGGTTWRKAWSGMKAVISDPIGAGRRLIEWNKNRTQTTLNQLDNWGKRTFGPRWGKMKDTLSQPVRSMHAYFKRVFGPGGGGVRKIFSDAVTAIGRIWNGIKSKMLSPVAWVINNVINKGIIRGINRIANFVKADPLKWVTPPKLATGGRLQGPGTPTSDSIPILGSRDEYMVRERSARKIGYDTLDYMNLHGSLPRPQGLALGGRVGKTYQPVPGRGNRHTGGYPWATWAGDYPNPTGTPVRAWKDGLVAAVKHLTTSYGKHIRMNHGDGSSSLYAHLSRILTRVGANVRGGQMIGQVGSTGNSTGPHLHFETMGKPYSGGAGSGGGGLLNRILPNVQELISGAASKAMKGFKQFVGSPWGKIISKIPPKLATMAVEWGREKLSDLNPFAGAGQNFGADRMGIAKTIVATAHRLGFGDRGAIIGLITGMVESGLRNVNFGDRDSLGVFQQRAPWGPRAVRLNPARAAQMFYQGGMGGQPGLRSKPWRSMGMGAAAQAVQVSAFPSRYAARIGEARSILDRLKPLNRDGGGSLPTGTSLVHNGTGRDEYVLTGSQWDAITNGVGKIEIDVTVQGGVVDDRTADRIADALERRMRRKGPTRVTARSR